MKDQHNGIPGWFGWIADRGVVFWRVFLLIVAGGFLTVAYIINGRLSQIERNLEYKAPQGAGHVEVVGMPHVIAKGQTVFVPAYSHVYHQDGKPFPVTTTLSINNTDPHEAIVVSSIEYFDTSGKLVRKRIQQPKQVAPLGSMEILVTEKDVEGGSGAKFIVKWVAEKQVHEPIIQTVMVGTSGGQGLSFICDGVVLDEVEED